MASSTLARAMATVVSLARHPSSSLLSPSRLISSSATVTQCLSTPALISGRRSLAPLSHALRSLIYSHTSRFIPVRCCVNGSGNPADSPPNFGSNSSDRPPMDMAALFPGCDYQHWLIVMDNPGGEGATKQEMIDCYIQTLAKVVGSDEEAKKKIYNVSCERYFGFGCEVDEKTSTKLGGLPGVLLVCPDSYVDPKHEDYGAELLVNGEIVKRTPEREKRVAMQPQSGRKKQMYEDKLKPSGSKRKSGET